MKFIFCFLLSMLFSSVVIFAQPPFGDYTGDGTANNPYKMYTKDHLYELRDTIWSDYVKISAGGTMWHKGKYFRLMQDITDTVKFTLFAFDGHFNGGGNKITVAITLDLVYGDETFFCFLYSGGSIDSLTFDGYTDGLSGIAGYVAPAHYMNLHPASVVSNCTSNVTINTIYSTVGGIVYSNSGTVIKCVNNGSITGVDRIGGVVGSNGMTGLIINCLNTGRITATSWTPNSIASGVGGIVGTISNGSWNGSTDGVFNNVNIGGIEGVGHVGGIIGLVRGMSPATPITNNLNYGFVKGANRVGGIVGWIFNAGVAIVNNSNFGVVVGEEDTGCIVGKNDGGAISNNHYDKQMCGE